MDLQLANTTVVQYINLYTSAKLEESKAQKLRDFFNQIQAIIQEAQTPMQPPMQRRKSAVTASRLLQNPNRHLH